MIDFDLNLYRMSIRWADSEPDRVAIAIRVASHNARVTQPLQSEGRRENKG